MNMTHEQQAALDKIRTIMNEHFDAWVLSYRLADENMRSSIHYQWQGDVTDVLGLAVVTKENLINICLPQRRN